MALNIANHKPKDIVFSDGLTVEWKDGLVSHYDPFPLRDACPCAGCIDELSGKKTLDPKSIPKDIHIRNCEYIGNYALRIDWSDGHSSGIYTYKFLRHLTETHDTSSVKN